MADLARQLLRAVPIGLPVAGRKRDIAFGILDPILRGTLRRSSITTPHGRLQIDPSHEPERLLAYLFHNVIRHYRRSELGRWILHKDRRGTTFVDVGANLGIYSLVAREAGMFRVCVEPDPAHSRFLMRNQAIFGSVLPAAFSDELGELPLYYEPGNPGATSLLPAANYLRGEGVVPVTTFTEEAAAGRLGDAADISIVKVDVEGFEAETVRGMGGYLDQGHRPEIWCEVRGDASGRNGGSYRIVRELLSRHGYRARELRRGRDVALDEDELAGRGVFDLLFTADGDPV